MMHLSPVSPLYYDRRNGGRKGVGLCPYPYRFIRKDFIMNKENNKSVIISFRVTPEEKKWIEDRSYGHYQLISNFVRDCVFKKEMIIITGANDVATELRRIGNNINQLTRAVNAGFVSQINLTDTRKELEKIWQSLNSLLRVAQ